MPAHHFSDRLGRTHDDLRVSVTDRCNLRCAYCMPNDPVWFPRSEILRFEEIETVVRAALSRGVSRVRITGGEPLVRRAVDRLIVRLAAEPKIVDLSMTTNGVLLEDAAPKLVEAGLHRINISVDTFDRGRFRSLTGRDDLSRVLRGIDAADRAGLRPIKINTVVMRGINDDEIERIVGTCRERGWEVRFIEFMPLENGNTWTRDRVVTGREVRERIQAVWPIEPDDRTEPGAPARRWRFRDGRGAVGFIDSVTRPFCGTCGRMRLTSDGKLRVCLYDDRETDLRAALRSGASIDQIADAIDHAVKRKGRGGALDVLERRRSVPLVRTMHQIGG